jgi:hypothetical protein
MCYTPAHFCSGDHMTNKLQRLFGSALVLVIMTALFLVMFAPVATLTENVIVSLAAGAYCGYLAFRLSL